MSDHTHYIPILRWKAAEQGALRDICPKDRKYITPLIEFIMPQLTAKDLKENRGKNLLSIAREKFLVKLPDELKKIEEYCGQNMLFIDTQLVDSKIRSEVLQGMIDFSGEAGLFLSPVIYIVPVLSSDSDMEVRKQVVAYAKKGKSGLCIRITRAHLSEESIVQDLEQFITNHHLDPTCVDMLIDLKFIEVSDSLPDTMENIRRISEMYQWRTFAVASGSFPKDLTEFRSHNDYNINRHEYHLWQKISEVMSRKPSFADYTIQHPEYTEPTLGANPSASIRYTLENGWLVRRGEGLRNPEGAGYKQYLAHAKVLVKQGKYYYGKDFSAGDAYIAEIAGQEEKTGNPRTWLQAGINHHITLTTRQVNDGIQSASGDSKPPA